jgi:membrane protein DedA with SNARE-associated domain
MSGHTTDESAPQPADVELAPDTPATETARPVARRRRKQFVYMLILAVGVASIILVMVLVKKPTSPVEYAKTIGYGGVFLMAVIGSFSPVWPLPGSWAAGLAAAFGLNPVLVGLAAGLGEPIGELSGYAAGYGGQIAINRWKRYAQIESWMKRHGGITIFVVSAIPNFFIKLATIAAGALRYPLWRFFLFCWAGKTIKSLGFALVGMAASDWLVGIFQSKL